MLCRLPSALPPFLSLYTGQKNLWNQRDVYLKPMPSTPGIWDSRISCSNRAYLDLVLCLSSQEKTTPQCEHLRPTSAPWTEPYANEGLYTLNFTRFVANLPLHGTRVSVMPPFQSWPPTQYGNYSTHQNPVYKNFTATSAWQPCRGNRYNKLKDRNVHGSEH